MNSGPFIAIWPAGQRLGGVARRFRPGKGCEKAWSSRVASYKKDWSVLQVFQT